MASLKRRRKERSGTFPIEVPQDHNGKLEPQIVRKHQTEFTGFGEKVTSPYAQERSTREIEQHLEDIYQVRYRRG